MLTTTGQRLAAFIACAVLFVSAVALGAQYLTVRQDLHTRLEQLVRSDLAGFAAAYDQRRIISVRQAIEFRLAQENSADLKIALRQRDGSYLAGTIKIWPPDGVVIPAEGETAPLQIMTFEGEKFIGTTRILAGSFPLLVARNTRELDAILWRMLIISGLALVAIAGVGIVAGQFASRRIIGKINRINHLANVVSSGDMTARLTGDPTPDEFGALQKNINHMLDRIETLNRATSYLSDTVAHELRTPLTRLQTRLSRLPETDQSEALQDEIRSTIRIFDSLLEIARAEADEGTRLAPKEIDLAALLHEICELYEPVAEERTIRFTKVITDDLPILGERNLIAQVISNLLENALKFTPSGESVSVTLQSGHDRQIMRITDTGKGVPDGFEPLLFDRFSRADPKGETAGHGLGLALVKAVALRHGAKLSVPVREKGFCIEIGWPKLNSVDPETR